MKSISWAIGVKIYFTLRGKEMNASQISKDFGISRTAVYRIMDDFHKDNLIIFSGKIENGKKKRYYKSRFGVFE